MRSDLDEVQRQLGWMYKTSHDGAAKGRINFTVWSEVFTCPECTREVIVEEALDKETKHVHNEFPCPSCNAKLTKDNLERSFETLVDPVFRTTLATHPLPTCSDQLHRRQEGLREGARFGGYGAP